MYNFVAIEGRGYLGRSVGGFGYKQLLSPKPIAIEHGAVEEQYERQSRIGERRKGYAVMAQACYDPA